MTEKKSFLLFNDLSQPFKTLSNEDAGILIKAIFEYQNGGIEQELKGVIGMAFTFIKQQLDRSDEQYKEKCEKNRQNIQKYWDQVKEKNTTVYDRKRMNTMATNNDLNPNPNPDSDKEEEDILSSTETELDDVSAFIEKQKKKKENIPYKEIITYFNSEAKTNYSHTTTATKNKIKARWNEGFRLEDFKIVIDVKVRSWLTDDKMVQYLRPDTLFSASKFEGYLQEGLKDMKVEPKVRCEFCGLTDSYHIESCQLYVKPKKEPVF